MNTPCIAAGLCASLALALPARPQSLTLDASPQQSVLSWTATSTLGPLQSGNPSFHLEGDLVLRWITSGPAKGQARFEGGELRMVPDIAARLQNAPPGQGSGSVLFQGARFTCSSPPFQAVPFAGFTTDLALEYTAGTLFVEPPVGPAWSFPLAGRPRDTVRVQGQLAYTPTGFQLVLSPLAFDLRFSGGGWTGTFACSGALQAEADCPVPASYCPPTPNSAGPGATLAGLGVPSIASNGLTLSVHGAPPLKSGVFLQGLARQQVPFGDGNLCVAGGVRRLAAVPTDAQGQALFTPDLAGLFPGETRTFQYWFRDPLPIGFGWNLSDAIEAFFCP
jgi:hypothetical protein